MTFLMSRLTRSRSRFALPIDGLSIAECARPPRRTSLQETRSDPSRAVPVQDHGERVRVGLNRGGPVEEALSVLRDGVRRQRGALSPYVCPGPPEQHLWSRGFDCIAVSRETYWRRHQPAVGREVIKLAAISVPAYLSAAS